MRVTTPELAALRDKLVVIAGGDIELVNEAIRAASKNGQPADLEAVVRFIQKHRNRQRSIA